MVCGGLHKKEEECRGLEGHTKHSRGKFLMILPPGAKERGKKIFGPLLGLLSPECASEDSYREGNQSPSLNGGGSGEDVYRCSTC